MVLMRTRSVIALVVRVIVILMLVFNNGVMGFHSVLPWSPQSRSSQRLTAASELTKPLEKSGSTEWDIYIDQSRPSVSKGGTTTLEVFLSLAPSESVKVHPSVLKSPTRAKSPIIRCLSRNDPDNCFEINNVDSVDKVHRILTRHLKVEGVDTSACESIKWKLKGNSHIEKGDISLAIDAYSNGLAIDFKAQEGALLTLRAQAYLQRASTHRSELKSSVMELTKSIPNASALLHLCQQAQLHPQVAPTALKKVDTYTKLQEEAFMKTKFRHGLYQYALLHATKDALRATQLLPQSSKSWLVAANALEMLLKFRESIKYYNKAKEIDPEALAQSITPEIERLDNRQSLWDQARAFGWSEDMLRLAFDVGNVEE